MHGHVLAKEKREKWSALFWVGGVLALGAIYVYFPEQVNSIFAGTFIAYFVGLPALLTWAWPVIVFVGLFLLVRDLSAASKRR
jgi:hypothetical protein